MKSQSWLVLEIGADGRRLNGKWQLSFSFLDHFHAPQPTEVSQAPQKHFVLPRLALGLNVHDCPYCRGPASLPPQSFLYNHKRPVKLGSFHSRLSAQWSVENQSHVLYSNTLVHVFSWRAWVYQSTQHYNVHLSAYSANYAWTRTAHTDLPSLYVDHQSCLHSTQ